MNLVKILAVSLLIAVVFNTFLAFSFFKNTEGSATADYSGFPLEFVQTRASLPCSTPPSGDFGYLLSAFTLDSICDRNSVLLKEFGINLLFWTGAFGGSYYLIRSMR